MDEGDEPPAPSDPAIAPPTGRPSDVAEFSRSLARCDLPEPGAPNSAKLRTARSPPRFERPTTSSRFAQKKYGCETFSL